MAWKDPYAILGLERGAPLSEIKRAYRKLAFSLHPDVGHDPDETRFREAHEAYQALIQIDQLRPPRRIKVARAPDRSGHAATMHVEPRGRPEPTRRRPPINVIDDFGMVSPSVGEILDHIAQNFFGFHQKSHGSRRYLGVEVVLDRTEAFFGVRLPIEVPVYGRCDRCGGSGGDWGVCASCHGYGMTETSRTVALEIASGARTGERYQIDLRGAGIENLVLDMTIVVV
ncbi:MAG TPA: DnaJ domain-containing protein [Nitrospira sp.]|nr:DnaJ domain-containing protein [Nitrospira sp.]